MADRGGLPWYQIWTEFSDHPKTLELCVLVKDDNAGMYVLRLWEHCAKQALDGRVKAAVVEGVCRWRRRRGVLLDALTAVGFIEAMADGYMLVHGWEERNGARIRHWLRDNAKRKTTKEDPEEVPPEPAGNPTENPSETPGGSCEEPPQNPPGFTGGTPSKPRGIDSRRKEETYVRSDSSDPLAAWRARLSDELAVTGRNPLRIADGERARRMREDIARLGVEHAVAICAEASRSAGKVPGTGDWFAGVLERADAPPTRRAPGELPKWGDHDFNDQAAWPSLEAFIRRDGPPMPVEGGAVRRLDR